MFRNTRQHCYPCYKTALSTLLQDSTLKPLTTQHCRPSYNTVLSTLLQHSTVSSVTRQLCQPCYKTALSTLLQDSTVNPVTRQHCHPCYKTAVSALSEPICVLGEGLHGTFDLALCRGHSCPVVGSSLQRVWSLQRAELHTHLAHSRQKCLRLCGGFQSATRSCLCVEPGVPVNTCRLVDRRKVIRDVLQYAATVPAVV